eukprot:jgi/Tetstr1/455417/TSEL_042249.t1
MNASVDGPSHALTSRGLESTLKVRPSLYVVLTMHLVVYMKQGNGEGEVCEVTPQWEAAAEEGERHHKAQHQRVKNLAATQAVPGDNVDEGSSPEPPAKKAKQAAKPAVAVPARGRGGAGRAMAGRGAFGSRAGRQAAVAAAPTREQHGGRRGGPGRNRM